MNTVRLRARALSAAAVGGLLLSVTVACGSESEGTASTEQGGEVWEEPVAYTYTLESTEGERALIGTFRVTVQNGDVTKAVGLDESGRRVVDQLPHQVPTIGELLDELAQARGDDADTAEAEYARDGHPERITLDWDASAIDDEALYVISDFERAEG